MTRKPIREKRWTLLYENCNFEDYYVTREAAEYWAKLMGHCRVIEVEIREVVKKRKVKVKHER